MSGFAMLTWIDLKLSLRNVIATFFTLAFPVLMILLFGAMYGNAPEANYRGFGAMDAAVPGYAATLVIGSAAFMGLPIELASRRQSGVLRRLRASPLSAAGRPHFSGAASPSISSQRNLPIGNPYENLRTVKRMLSFSSTCSSTSTKPRSSSSFLTFS